MSKINELLQEIKSVFSGRIPLLDVILPPLLFTLLNELLSLQESLIIALISAGAFLAYRAWKKQALGYTLSGAAITVLAGILAWVSQSPKGFFLPGVITSGITFLLALVSIFAKRPLAGWSSHLTRGWPLDWYWHPRVRPAYNQVTWGWTVFFGLQFAIQGYFFLVGSASSLGIIQLLTGWPALIIVLAASYLYGQWRLGKLEGPGVDEYLNQSPPPWEGQQRGF
jgi:hypothetical protein